MKKFDITVLTVIVLVVMFICWYIREERLKGSIYRNVDRSVGIFDEPARKALYKSTRLTYPSMHDHVTAARLIDLNMHEGHINNPRDLQNAVSHYMKALNRPDELDWFEIDQIENFERRYGHHLEQDVYYTDFVKAVTKARPAKVAKVVNEIKEKSDEADSKIEVIQTFVENNVEHPSDAQNVHDSAVNVELRKSVDNLKRITAPHFVKSGIETFAEVKSEIKNLDFDSDRQKKAQSALETIKKGSYNASLDMKEDDLLCLVWSRSRAPENMQNGNDANIRRAIIEALIDMVPTEGNVVCSSGRCARLVESLAVIDASQAVSGAMTVQELRNEALKDVQKILEAHIEETASSTDSALADVARSYKNPSIETKESAENTFKEYFSTKVLQNLEKKYKTRMAIRDYDSLKTYIMEAVSQV